MNKDMASDKLYASGVLQVIGQMDIETLRLLNHQVVTLINHKNAHEAVGLSLSFRVGDKVTFGNNRVGTKNGEIIKVNRTKAVVAVKQAFGNSPAALAVASTVKWNVPFSMLTKV